MHILPPLRRHAERREPFIALTAYPTDDGGRQQGIGGVFDHSLAQALGQRALMIYAFDDTEGVPPIADALAGAGADGPWVAFAFFPMVRSEDEAWELMDRTGMDGEIEPLDDESFLCPPVVLAYALREQRVRNRLWHLARQGQMTETWVDFDGELCAHQEHAPPPWFRARLRRALMAAEAVLA